MASMDKCEAIFSLRAALHYGSCVLHDMTRITVSREIWQLSSQCTYSFSLYRVVHFLFLLCCSMSIVNLLLKPLICFFLYQIYLLRGGNVKEELSSLRGMKINLCFFFQKLLNFDYHNFKGQSLAMCCMAMPPYCAICGILTPGPSRQDSGLIYPIVLYH